MFLANNLIQIFFNQFNSFLENENQEVDEKANGINRIP